jgi:short subunit dehydrogenase-like uncharacterized protein
MLDSTPLGAIGHLRDDLMKTILIYGAYGYTGRLIVERALAESGRPVLGGRREAPLRMLAEETGLSFRAFDLADLATDSDALDGVSTVIHAAGPFVHTAQPMMEACLKAGVHYLDITGEIAVFERAARLHEQAIERGITLCPGVGFDVVPTDCLAARVAARLPGATHLELAFATRGGVSRGTALTAIEGLDQGSAERVDGRIVALPSGAVSRRIPFADKERHCVGIPWGDVSTAFYSTGIPNVRTLMAMPASQQKWMRRMGAWPRLMGSAPVKAVARSLVKSRLTGPDETARSEGWTQLWCEVRKGGESVSDTLTCEEGYQLTAKTAWAAAQACLGGDVPAGFQTPSRAFGADFVVPVTLDAAHRESSLTN